MGPEDLNAVVRPELDEIAVLWVDDALTRAGKDASTLRALFPGVGRSCGRGVTRADPRWTVDDAVRVLLLAGAPGVAAELTGLYHHGDAAEKRAILRGLSFVDVGAAGVPLVADGLRTNDTRLVAAAMGEYAAAHLSPQAYRHGVLKCVFLGVPLSEVAGLHCRIDAGLVRMLRSFAAERALAGRCVPDDFFALVPELSGKDT